MQSYIVFGGLYSHSYYSEMRSPLPDGPFSSSRIPVAYSRAVFSFEGVFLSGPVRISSVDPFVIIPGFLSIGGSQ